LDFPLTAVEMGKAADMLDMIVDDVGEDKDNRMDVIGEYQKDKLPDIDEFMELRKLWPDDDRSITMYSMGAMEDIEDVSDSEWY